MTDDPTTPERGAEPESAELPIPKLSAPSPVSSPSGTDIDAIAEKVAEKIQRDLRMAQSKKDKNAELVKRTYGISDLAELEALGATIPENVKLEYRLQQIEGARQQPPASSQPPSSNGNGEALTAQDVQTVVKNLSLDANDAEVLEKLRGTYRNRDHFEATMSQLALSRVTKSPPSPASSTALSGGKTTPDNEKTVITNYEAELAKIPRGNVLAVSNLKAKYREEARKKGFILNI